MPAQSIRAFIGIDLDDEIREKLLAIQRKKLNLDQFSSVKAVDPKTAHITLGFLGNKTPGELSAIAEALRSVSFHPFCVTLSGVGVFPNLNKIRVVHVGLRDSESVRTLHAQIVDALKGKYEPEKRKFDPHITLGRVKRIVPEELNLLAATIASLSVTPIGNLNVSAFQLKRSTLTPKGPIYDTIEEFQL